MTTTTEGTTTINHFINGVETAGEGDRTTNVYNPATGAVSGELRLANRADLDNTVAAARAAADTWGDISLAKRTAVLFKFRELVASHIDELAQLITAEHGKVLSDAKAAPERGGPILIHVESDPLLDAPSSESWWDVPVSQVSDLESTQQAYQTYTDHKSRQRKLLG